ncbi:MAG: arginine--tRNA ligase [Myxococcales bacterium]|nr:arginine--tRNA ligase [Myxococcales bacterium]
MSQYTPFHEKALRTAAEETGQPAASFAVSAPPKPEMGDLAVGCFAAAKALGRSPVEIAKDVAAAFVPSDELASATAAGPFVNFRVARPAVFAWLADGVFARRALTPANVGAGQTVCIDYSSPNISKHLAYHHIRSTVIGQALAQMHRALGYRVVGINHLGDWGTTHGMLLAAHEKWGEPSPLDITALNDLYVRFRAAMKEDPALEQKARAWFHRLEAGDPAARATWQRFRDVSWAEFQSVYDMLGIVFDEVRGESAYEAAMPGVIDMLAQKQLTSESEGALVVQIPGEQTPLLLKTKDGTTLYATRDIAAAMYRWETYQFTRSLYVVDRGQGLHFKQLFAVLGMAGFEWASRCEHVPFGLVRIGGKKTGTRAGNVVLLKDVFNEATDEVAAKIREGAGGGAMTPAQIAEVAQMVGIGGVVFATLVSQRDKDVDFVLEKVLSLDGDSGPYLQYSHARCASILRKGGVAASELPAANLALLTHDAEWAVARRLLDFGDTVVRAAAACEPHTICHYLLNLAGDFSRWYTLGNGDASLRVICDDADLRLARLALVAMVGHALAEGLRLIGLGAPDQM